MTSKRAIVCLMIVFVVVTFIGVVVGKAANAKEVMESSIARISVTRPLYQIEWDENGHVGVVRTPQGRVVYINDFSCPSFGPGIERAATIATIPRPREVTKKTLDRLYFEWQQMRAALTEAIRIHEICLLFK